MELLADSCVLSLHPVVNVPKARWAFRNLWRFHLNLWHIKANTSHIVVVHLLLDILQFCHLLFKLLLLIGQFCIAVRELWFDVGYVLVSLTGHIPSPVNDSPLEWPVLLRPMRTMRLRYPWEFILHFILHFWMVFLFGKVRAKGGERRLYSRER